MNEMIPSQKLHKIHETNHVQYVKSATKKLFDHVAAMGAKKFPAQKNGSASTSDNNLATTVALYSDDEDNFDDYEERLNRLKDDIKREFRCLREEAKRDKPGSGEKVLEWYKEQHLLVSNLYQFAQAIYSIPPSQIENERDFSLAGVYNRPSRASMTVQMMSNLLFINKNHRMVKNAINIFEETSDEVLEQLKEMEEIVENIPKSKDN